MIWVLCLLLVPVSALVTNRGLRAAGVPRREALWAALAAGAATGVAFVALALTAFGECVGENPDRAPDPSWPWSPRREFCDDRSSPAALGALALLLVPTAAVMLGTFLRSKQHQALSWTAYAILLATPVLPSVYIGALPVYRVDSHPVLHRPLLRPVSASKPARVCYLYGIAFGPRKVEVTSGTTRHCVELKPTPQALSLTPKYDLGQTSYDLDWMGRRLTEKGLPVRPGDTGVDGLVVDRAYKLPESQARIGAKPID
jgi:hypothetical protein